MSLDRDMEIPDVLRPGFPASVNSRLNLGLGLGVLTPCPTGQPENQPSTTIRLISNNANLSYYAGKTRTSQLRPFATTSVNGDDLKAAGKRAGMNSEGINGTPQLQPFKATRVFSDTGKRDSEGQLSVLEGDQKKSGEKIRLEREHEAIRKKLEANRARRRSSAAHGGRKSGKISTRRPSVLGKPNPKPSRFGLLSSAKSLVQSVWNRGKAPAPSIASNIPKPTVTNVTVSTKSASSKARTGPPSLGSKKRTSIAASHSTTASGSRIPLPVKKQGIDSSDSMTLAGGNSNQQPPTGRKPRISRSKVIARLALQRTADGNGLDPTCGNSGAKIASNNTRGRTRSSVGAKVSRPSYGGGTMSRASGEERVLLSARRRARQSEYAKRKSKVAATAPLVLDGRYPVFKRSG